MRALLSRYRDSGPDREALSWTASDGTVESATRAELVSAAECVVDRAQAVTGTRAIAVVVDGSPVSVATALGVVASGRDVLLLEGLEHEPDDPASPVRIVAPDLVVAPTALTARGGSGLPLVLSYEEFATRTRPGSPASTARSTAGEVLQLTSGSTGVPRVTRHRATSVLRGAATYRELFELTVKDRVALPVPLVHSYGLAALCSGLLSGAVVETSERFSPQRLVATLRGRTTVLFGTPLLFRLLEPVLAAGTLPAELRLALSAGGPLPAERAERAGHALGVPIRQIYGTTEVGLLACVPAAEREWPAGAVGPPAPGVSLRVARSELTAGGSGRLLARTPTMFEGYWGDDDSQVDEDGYYDTGDFVSMTTQGHLVVLGRKEAHVNVGGRKVSPPRVERALLSHPAVHEAYVFGLERSDGEEEVHAAVVLDPTATPGDVVRAARARGLAAHEVPHQVHAVGSLPRTGMGKVDRRRVIEAVDERSARPPRVGGTR